MIFNVISAMGECVRQSLDHGVVGRSFQKKINHLNIRNPRSFTEDVHQTIDDRPFGGGDGMLMMAEPLHQCLKDLSATSDTGRVFIMSPQGRLWTDVLAAEVAQENAVTFVCGRYAGVDERFRIRNGIEEISIGDYVLSGGELACAVMIDSIARKVPDVLGHQSSAELDSLSVDGLLEAPQFTRPRIWESLAVPEVFLQGDHKKIESFRHKLSWLVTLQKRPELIRQRPPKGLKLGEFISELSVEAFKCLGLDKEALIQAMKRREW